MRTEDAAHGGKHEHWHERCAMRAEEQRHFDNYNAPGFHQAGEGKDLER